MSEIEVRLSQLHEAAETLHRSGMRLRYSVQEITAALDPLFLLGIDAPDLQTRYALLRGRMGQWAETILYFADKLGAAATEIERVQQQFPVTPTFGRAQNAHLAEPQPEPAATPFDTLAAPSASSPLPQPVPITYVSAANQPAYTQMLALQDNLSEQHTRVSLLLTQREQTLSELEGLQNRLLSYDASVDLASVPRLQHLHAEVNRLDADIEALTGDIDRLQTDYLALNSRLGMLQPGEGANLALIRALETGQTPAWIKESTFDCVNYIVHRLPIPPGIALDAHEWNEAAQRLSQFGIQQGDVPLPGAVIVMEREHSFADDVYGHLLYVERVDDGGVWVTDNYHPDEPVRLADLTREMRSQHLTYLYFPWHTRL